MSFTKKTKKEKRKKTAKTYAKAMQKTSPNLYYKTFFLVIRIKYFNRRDISGRNIQLKLESVISGY